MRKIIITIAAAIIMIAVVLFFIKPISKGKNVPSNPLDSSSSTGLDGSAIDSVESDTDRLEELTEDEPEEITEIIKTSSDKLAQNELYMHAEEINDLLTNYSSTIFTFSEQTEDFSDILASYFGTSEYFIEDQVAFARNIYPEFTGVNMKSEFRDFEYREMIIDDNDICLEASVLGNIHASFENDMVPLGDYQVSCSFVLLYEDDEWKIDKAVIDNVFQADGFTVYYKENTAENALAYQGVCVMSWDFTDVEGFLNGFSRDIDIDSYDEFHDYTHTQAE